MGADVIVLSEPLVDDDLGLSGGEEPLGVKDLLAQGASLTPTARHAVTTSLPDARCNSISRRSFRISSSE